MISIITLMLKLSDINQRTQGEMTKGINAAIHPGIGILPNMDPSITN
jgi:hypothetical protein